jgi:hypothetical protein
MKLSVWIGAIAVWGCSFATGEPSEEATGGDETVQEIQEPLCIAGCQKYTTTRSLVGECCTCGGAKGTFVQSALNLYSCRW